MTVKELMNTTWDCKSHRNYIMIESDVKHGYFEKGLERLK